MINKSIKFKNNEYLLKYPTVGQLIDIRVSEQLLSKGTSKDLLMGLNADIDSYVYITTIAHIQVLLPELVKDLKVPLRDLDPLDFEELVNLFSNEISPWLTEWQEGIKEKMKQKSE
jgi:hypothetical protein